MGIRFWEGKRLETARDARIFLCVCKSCMCVCVCVCVCVLRELLEKRQPLSESPDHLLPGGFFIGIGSGCLDHLSTADWRCSLYTGLCPLFGPILPLASMNVYFLHVTWTFIVHSLTTYLIVIYVEFHIVGLPQMFSSSIRPSSHPFTNIYWISTVYLLAVVGTSGR